MDKQQSNETIDARLHLYDEILDIIGEDMFQSAGNSIFIPRDMGTDLYEQVIAYNSKVSEDDKMFFLNPGDKFPNDLSSDYFYLFDLYNEEGVADDPLEDLQILEFNPALKYKLLYYFQPDSFKDGGELDQYMKFADEEYNAGNNIALIMLKSLYDSIPEDETELDLKVGVHSIDGDRTFRFDEATYPVGNVSLFQFLPYLVGDKVKILNQEDNTYYSIKQSDIEEPSSVTRKSLCRDEEQTVTYFDMKFIK